MHGPYSSSKDVGCLATRWGLYIAGGCYVPMYHNLENIVVFAARRTYQERRPIARKREKQKIGGRRGGGVSDRSCMLSTTKSAATQHKKNW